MQKIGFCNESDACQQDATLASQAMANAGGSLEQLVCSSEKEVGKRFKVEAP
jgi:hypothetical protein